MLVNQTKKQPRQAEKTGPQTISYSMGQGILAKSTTTVGTYKELRAVRKDPTVSLARAVLISCIQAGSWNVEADEGFDEAKDFIEHLFDLREDFLFNTIAYGKVDFGWCGFEKIFKVEGDKIRLDILKPLLHDMTNILVTPKGRFNGYRQSAYGVGAGTANGTIGPIFPIDLPVEKCLHTAFGVEAGNYYGMPLLENIRATMNMWDECNDGARRYDLKLAGSHWVISYPPGTGILDGETVANGVIATKLLDAMLSSGSVCIPTTTATVLQEIINAEVADLYAWHVELKSDTPKQGAFGKRLMYLDNLKVRGLLMPERSLLEGQHGTKAEAGEHIGLMLANLEAVDRQITRIMNNQVVNQLLWLNYGAESIKKVRLVSAPLVDKQISFLREIYGKVTDPDVDVQALRDKLEIPTKIAGNVPEVEEDDEQVQAKEGGNSDNNG